MRNKIGLFGGSFDPVHLGHLIIASLIRSEFGLDNVIFVPNYTSPFKTDRGTSDISHRIEMVKLSIKGDPYFSVSEFEAEKKRPVFTYETIEHFKEIYKNAEIFLILGYDTFANIKKWKNYDYIASNVNFVTAPRNTSAVEKSLSKVRLPEHYESRFCPVINISSTLIREMVAKKIDIKYLVNKSVRRYINDRGLYL